VRRGPRIRVKALMQRAAVALLLCTACVFRPLNAQSLCQSCELQVGIGETYHFWGTTDGVVLPVTLNWSDARYEFALFRISTRQILYDAHYRYGRLMADPYWGLSLSRRWRLFDRGPAEGSSASESLQRPSRTSSASRAGTLRLSWAYAFRCQAIA